MPEVVEESGPAEIAFTGEWEIKCGPSPETVHLTLRYPPSASNCGGAIAPATLGLSDRDLSGTDLPLHFELVRDAGTFECKGAMATLRGGGSFRFRPGTAYADAIVQAGLPPLTLQQHVKAAMFDLSLSFVIGIVATGLPNFTLSQLLSFKICRMKPEDIAAFHAVFPSEGADELLLFGVLRIKPEYVYALRRAKIRGVTAANVAALHASGVDRSFIEGLAASGQRGLSIDEVAKLCSEAR